MERPQAPPAERAHNPLPPEPEHRREPQWRRPTSITIAVPSRSQLAFTLMLSASSVCSMVLKACDTLCAAVIAPSRAPAGQFVGLTRSLLGDYQNDARASWQAFSPTYARLRKPTSARSSASVSRSR